MSSKNFIYNLNLQISNNSNLILLCPQTVKAPNKPTHVQCASIKDCHPSSCWHQSTPPHSALSREGAVPSTVNMNKTSCYSFLDKHPASARKQVRGKRWQALVFLQQRSGEDGLPRRSPGAVKWSYAAAKVSS